MKSEFFIGVMSGTSMDGVDVVFCQVDANKCHLLESYEHTFPKSLKTKILSCIENTVSVAKIGEVDHEIALLFADAVNTFLNKLNIDPKTVTAIGLHGQTLWHEPKSDRAFTMQLGDPSIVAARTGIVTVADFRRKDMAFGGSGAPLAPAFHKFIFKNIENRTAVVNLGGIANITIVQEPLVGYDIGPGNMLMDAWIGKHRDLPYDKDGNWAREGKVDYKLLDKMMQDNYFHQLPPKSTGRERFNEKWLQAHLDAQCSVLSASSVQRTLLELTAVSISNEVLRFNPDILMLCGGGARNSFLVERIATLIPNIQVGIIEHADALEAMMMAWLAYKRIHNEVVELKDVTGAVQNTILGGVYQ